MIVLCTFYVSIYILCFFFFFFFNDTATTEIYTLSLHDALPICRELDRVGEEVPDYLLQTAGIGRHRAEGRDRKSTRLNSSHGYISYAVFCLKKKKNKYPDSSLYKKKQK